MWNEGVRELRTALCSPEIDTQHAKFRDPEHNNGLCPCACIQANVKSVEIVASLEQFLTAERDEPAAAVDSPVVSSARAVSAAASPGSDSDQQNCPPAPKVPVVSQQCETEAAFPDAAAEPGTAASAAAAAEEPASPGHEIEAAQELNNRAQAARSPDRHSPAVFDQAICCEQQSAMATSTPVSGTPIVLSLTSSPPTLEPDSCCESPQNSTAPEIVAAPETTPISSHPKRKALTPIFRKAATAVTPSASSTPKPIQDQAASGPIQVHAITPGRALPPPPTPAAAGADGMESPSPPDQERFSPLGSAAKVWTSPPHSPPLATVRTPSPPNADATGLREMAAPVAAATPDVRQPQTPAIQQLQTPQAAEQSPGLLAEARKIAEQVRP